MTHKDTKRKKIIRITTVPGSLETFCHGQLSELQRRGYEIVAVSSPLPDLQVIADREGVRTLAVPMERHISPVSDLRSLWQLIRLFRRERPDMVHSMTPKAGLLSMLAARLTGVPVRAHTFTGLIWPTATGTKRKILMATDRILCSCATHILPEGQGVLNDLANFGITHKELRILGNGNVRGIDPDYYNPDDPEVKAGAAALRKPDVLTFIFVGRVVRDKGIVELVEAFSRLHAAHPATRLILVGAQETALDPLPQATRDAIGRNDAILAVGSQKDVRPWMAAADVLAFPSYREGFPNVVLEAGAMSLPSIVTDINGSREIVRDGFNGLVVPPHDVQALHDAMLLMLSDADKRRQMASVARKRVLDNWSREIVSNALYAFYNEVLPARDK